MFQSTAQIEEYLLSQDAAFADKVLSAYNTCVGVIKPVTLEQCENIMWDVLDWFDLV